MFALPKVSQLLQSHIKWPSHTNVVCDIHDSDEWKSLYAKDGFFAGDVRGISFSLCTDGLNPFSKERCQYSMWLIMLNILNFPSYIRSKAEIDNPTWHYTWTKRTKKLRSLLGSFSGRTQ